MKNFDFKIRIFTLIFLTFLFIYLIILFTTYGVNHYTDPEVKFLEDNFGKAIPNIYSCNFDYFSINEHIANEEFEHVRFRKIITTNPDCFGKIAYTGITPGTKFDDIDPSLYLEFGVNQKLGHVLWLFEKNFLLFLFVFLTLLLLQSKLVKQNIFKYFLILIFIYSLVNFDTQNMYINSSKHYFPNENSKSENLLNSWFLQND